MALERVKRGAIVLALLLICSAGAKAARIPIEPRDEIASIPGDHLVLVGRVVHIENAPAGLPGGPLPLVTFAVVRPLRGVPADTVRGFGYNTFLRQGDGEWAASATSDAPWLLPDDLVLVSLQAFTREVEGRERTLNRVRTVFFLDGDDLRDGSPLYRHSTFAGLRDRPVPATDDLETLLRAYKAPPSRPIGVTLGQADEMIRCPLPPVPRSLAPKAQTGPRFSFWGNLPEAVPDHEPDPGRQHPPLPVPETDLRSAWSVRPDEPLFLLRGGRLAGTGRVGAIWRGWWPRAGDDRIAYFTPVGLPDSVVPRVPAGEDFFPNREDPDYDFYVMGCTRIAVVLSDTLPVPPQLDLHAAVCGLESRRTIDGREFQELRALDAEGRIVPPTTRELADHLAGKGAFSLLEVANQGGQRFDLLVCSPVPGRTGGSFVVVFGADGRRSGAIKGCLDTILEIDGGLHLVVRDGSYGSGAWGYGVYRLDELGTPILVHADGFWST